jgi:hypothetical protein
MTTDRSLERRRAPKRNLGTNLGTIAPRQGEIRAIRADQEARRVNNLDEPALSAKPPPPVQIRAVPPLLILYVTSRGRSFRSRRRALVRRGRRAASLNRAVGCSKRDSRLGGFPHARHEMCRRCHHRLARIGRAAIAGLLLLRSPVSAQDVTEPALKAAFIYNFAKFTEWPGAPAPAHEPFVLCVVGDAAVGDALVRAVKTRVLGGQNLSVSFITPRDPAPKCRLIYISGVTAREAAQLVAGLRDVPVLTISDLEEFTERGGIARFFFEHGLMRPCSSAWKSFAGPPRHSMATARSSRWSTSLPGRAPRWAVAR